MRGALLSRLGRSFLVPHELTHCSFLICAWGPWAVRVGCIYLLSGISGAILSSLFLFDTVSVGASGALFGLIGSTLAELLAHWTEYTNRVSREAGAAKEALVEQWWWSWVVCFVAVFGAHQFIAADCYQHLCGSHALRRQFRTHRGSLRRLSVGIRPPHKTW